MGATATRERRGAARGSALPARYGGGRRFEPQRATLDDRMTALWSRLVETGEADCPVCGAGITAGRPCGVCGSELS
jgi:hypothetical protein